MLEQAQDGCVPYARAALTPNCVHMIDTMQGANLVKAAEQVIQHLQPRETQKTVCHFAVLLQSPCGT